METSERGLGRIVSFSDGVVAIAITLLVLPLTAISPEPYGGDIVALLRANEAALVAFVISFAVVARYWLAHHRVFGRVARADRTLLTLNLLWLFAIVFLPFPTALVEGTSEAGAIVFYMVCLLVMSALTRVLAWYVDRTAGLTDVPPGPEDVAGAISARVTIVVLVAAICVALVAPRWGLSVLYALFVVPLLVRAWLRRGERRREARPAT